MPRRSNLTSRATDWSGSDHLGSGELICRRWIYIVHSDDLFDASVEEVASAATRCDRAA